MFDLEKSIADWREQMLVAGIQTPVPLEELEIHLREEIERQMKSGLNEQKAFEASIQQIGRPQMLKNEFEKVDGAKEAHRLKQYRIIMVASLAVESLFWATCLILKTGCFSEITAVQQMSGLAAVAVMVLFAGIGLLGHGPFFPAILNRQAREEMNRRMRDLICIAGARLGGMWCVGCCYVVLPFELFTLGNFGVGGLWVMLPPAGVLFGFIGGLEKNALKKTSMADS